MLTSKSLIFSLSKHSHAVSARNSHNVPHGKLSFQILGVREHNAKSSFEWSEKPCVVLRKYPGRWEPASELIGASRQIFLLVMKKHSFLPSLNLSSLSLLECSTVVLGKDRWPDFCFQRTQLSGDLALYTT